MTYHRNSGDYTKSYKGDIQIVLNQFDHDRAMRYLQLVDEDFAVPFRIPCYPYKQWSMNSKETHAEHSVTIDFQNQDFDLKVLFSGRWAFEGLFLFFIIHNFLSYFASFFLCQQLIA